MKLSTRARYALRFMVTISKMSDGVRPVSLSKIAKHTQISRRYLEKLVIALKQASLLRPVAGRSGGYLLARSAKDISVGQIIEASIGPINIVKCVRDPGSCLISDCCECRMIYMLINQGIEKVLNDYSLADMTGVEWRERVFQHMLPDQKCDAMQSAQKQSCN